MAITNIARRGGRQAVDLHRLPTRWALGFWLRDRDQLRRSTHSGGHCAFDPPAMGLPRRCNAALPTSLPRPRSARRVSGAESFEERDDQQVVEQWADSQRLGDPAAIDTHRFPTLSPEGRHVEDCRSSSGMRSTTISPPRPPRQSSPTTPIACIRACCCRYEFGAGSRRGPSRHVVRWGFPDLHRPSDRVGPGPRHCRSTSSPTRCSSRWGGQRNNDITVEAFSRRGRWCRCRWTAPGTARFGRGRRRRSSTQVDGPVDEVVVVPVGRRCARSAGRRRST